MAGVVKNIYSSILQRSSTFAVTVVVAAFMFERSVDVGGQYLFSIINKDVRAQYQSENHTPPTSGIFLPFFIRVQGPFDLGKSAR